MVVNSDTIGPGVDIACKEIVDYVAEQINREYAALVPQGLAVKKAIAWDAWNSSAAEFPLLTVHRIKSHGDGLQNCDGAVTYYLGGVAELETFSGNLRWVEVQIVRALRKFNAYGNLHAIVKQEFESEHETDRKYPYVRVKISFREIGV